MICARPSACGKFASCEAECAQMPPQFEACSGFTDSCDVFRNCIDCTNICKAATKCNPPVWSGCWDYCVAKPSCYDKNLPACEAVAACK
jgi:hypothetical protein